MCEGHRRTSEKLWNFLLSSLWEKKKWHRNTVKSQIFARYPFSYFWHETGSSELIFVLSRAWKQNAVGIRGSQSEKKFSYRIKFRCTFLKSTKILLLLFHLIPLQINSAKCTFVFPLLNCQLLSAACMHIFFFHISTHSSGICTHTYTVARASVTHACTHAPMLLSKQGFFPLLPLLSPAICDTSLLSSSLIKLLTPIKK